MKKPRILIACEVTGKVRDAFTKLGADATSCDIKPSEKKGKHYQGDVLDIIGDGWDAMIGFPPCTYTTYAGTSVWNEPGRARKRLNALDFFLTLWEADIPFICLENPFGVVDAVIEKHHQQIHPFYFGEQHMKRTCLWLKNLPPLEYHLGDTLFGESTSVAKPKPIYTDKNGKKRYYVDALSGKNGGAAKRSETFSSIAEAMAGQWMDIIRKGL